MQGIKMRINKFLASAGIGSRRKVEELVTNGLITVNGEVVTNLVTDISENDMVEFKGKRVSLAENKVYFMLNKPKCYITSVSDEKGRKTVLNLMKGVKERVFPVGRLDYNTEGLLLLTNDGDFANSIIHPSKHISKTYEVFTRVKPTSSGLNQLKKGVNIDGVAYMPAILGQTVKYNDGFLTTITIFEGKNHQVKNMFSYIGAKVYDLKRIKIGELTLGDLQNGKFRKLDDNELKKIFI